MTRHLALILSLAAAAVAGRAADIQAQAGFTWAGNLSRTSARGYRQDAAIYSGSVTAFWNRQIARDWLLAASGEAGMESVPKFDALDTLRAGAHLRLRRKFGLGPLAPALELQAGLTRNSVHEGGRTGWKSEAGVALSKRVSESLRLAVGGGWEADATSHPAFDLHSRHLSLEAAWSFADRWQLDAGTKRQWGQLTANIEWDIWETAITGGFGERVRDYYRATPWETSNTFGPGWVAYRIDGTADFRWVQLSFDLGADTSVPLRYETVKVINRVGVHYGSDFLSLGIVHRF